LVDDLAVDLVDLKASNLVEKMVDDLVEWKVALSEN
jgi:hypothetical protein